MDSEKLQELAAGYCLNALDADDHALFEKLLQEGDAKALALYADFSAVAGTLSFAADPQPVDPELKSRVIDSLNPAVAKQQALEAPTGKKGDADASVPVFWRQLTWGLSFAVLLIAISSIFYISSLQLEITALREQNDLDRALIKSMQTDISRQKNYLTIFQSSELMIVDLVGQDIAANSAARIYYSPERRRGVFFSTSLEPISEDKVYQLWMIRGSQPVSAGIISRLENGLFSSTLENLTDPSAIDAFAVSLEPQGGVDSPTGPIYLVGTVEKS